MLIPIFDVVALLLSSLCWTPWSSKYKKKISERSKNSKNQKLLRSFRHSLCHIKDAIDKAILSNLLYRDIICVTFADNFHFKQKKADKKLNELPISIPVIQSFQKLTVYPKASISCYKHYIQRLFSIERMCFNRKGGWPRIDVHISLNQSLCIEYCHQLLIVYKYVI